MHARTYDRLSSISHADEVPVPLRISAMVGASLLLWSAILIPFLV